MTPAGARREAVLSLACFLLGGGLQGYRGDFGLSFVHCFLIVGGSAGLRLLFAQHVISIRSLH